MGSTSSRRRGACSCLKRTALRWRGGWWTGLWQIWPARTSMDKEVTGVVDSCYMCIHFRPAVSICVFIFTHCCRVLCSSSALLRSVCNVPVRTCPNPHPLVQEFFRSLIPLFLDSCAFVSLSLGSFGRRCVLPYGQLSVPQPPLPRPPPSPQVITTIARRHDTNPFSCAARRPERRRSTYARPAGRTGVRADRGWDLRGQAARLAEGVRGGSVPPTPGAPTPALPLLRRPPPATSACRGTRTGGRR